MPAQDPTPPLTLPLPSPQHHDDYGSSDADDDTDSKHDDDADKDGKHANDSDDDSK